MMIFPPNKRGTALAIWSMTTLVAPICGPILGGYISDNFTWPWIFYHQPAGRRPLRLLLLALHG
jgi:DHA2 family multidrug resistance protein